MGRWGIGLIAATVVLAGVVGVLILTDSEDFDLEPELVAIADARWDDINELERDALCERLSTSEGRAQAFRELEQLLFEQEMGADPDDAIDLLKPASTDAQRAREAKATEMVRYVQSKC